MCLSRAFWAFALVVAAVAAAAAAAAARAGDGEGVPLAAWALRWVGLVFSWVSRPRGAGVPFTDPPGGCARVLGADLTLHGAFVDAACLARVVEARGGLRWAPTTALSDVARQAWAASQADRYAAAAAGLAEIYHDGASELDALVRDAHASCAEPFLFMTVSRHSPGMLENWVRHIGAAASGGCALAVVFVCEESAATVTELRESLSAAAGGSIPVSVLDGPSVLNTTAWPLCEHTARVDPAIYGDVASGVKIKAAVEILRRAARVTHRAGGAPLRLVYSDTDVVWLHGLAGARIQWDADLLVSSYHFAIDTAYAGSVAAGDVCMGQWIALPTLASVTFFSHLFGRMTTFAGATGVASCDDQAVYSDVVSRHSARIVQSVAYKGSTLVWGRDAEVDLMLRIRVLPTDLFPTLPNYAFGIGTGGEGPVSVHATNWHDIDGKAFAFAERGLWRATSAAVPAAEGGLYLHCSALGGDGPALSYAAQESEVAKCLAHALATGRAFIAPQLVPAALPSHWYLRALGASILGRRLVPFDLFYAPSCLRHHGFAGVPSTQADPARTLSSNFLTPDDQVRADAFLSAAQHALHACRSRHNLIPY